MARSRVFWFSGSKQAGLSELNAVLVNGAAVQYFGVTSEGVLVIVGPEQKNGGGNRAAAKKL